MRPYVGYGGTFDPVHMGHLAVAIAVRDALGVDVALVPAADPPHKTSTHADAMHRRRMLELATAGMCGLHVDPRELQREGPSYSVDTLQALRDELGPEAPLVWVIGADSLAQLHTWSRWRRLFELAHVLVAARPGHALDPGVVTDADARAVFASRLAAPERLLDSPAGHLALLVIDPARPESSTSVRRAISQGGAWRHQVPPAVAAYIDRHRLYAEAAAA